MSLRLTGAVRRPLRLTREDLEPMERFDAPLRPFHTEPKGEGVPVRVLLDMAGPSPRATHVRVVASDGFSGVASLEEFRSLGVLLFHFEGTPLPEERGGPFRLVMPGSSNPCASVKGVGEVEVREGRFEEPPNPHLAEMATKTG